MRISKLCSLARGNRCDRRDCRWHEVWLPHTPEIKDAWPAA